MQCNNSSLHYYIYLSEHILEMEAGSISDIELGETLSEVQLNYMSS